MLTFVDGSSHIKICRLEVGADGVAKRPVIGKIRKKDLELDPALSQLFGEEREQLRKILTFYETAHNQKDAQALYTFPETARRVVEYTIAKGERFEMEAVLTTIVESLRVLRREIKNVPREQDKVLRFARG